ncbi:thymidylate kinase isoform 4-T4 [Podargus strigoides]
MRRPCFAGKPVPLMKEKLHQGITLVVDRYAFSGVAFTSAKENFCLDWCKQPDVGLPRPDLILFLQLSPEKAAERGNFGNERYENSSFQEKVLQSFYHLMKDKTLNWKDKLTNLGEKWWGTPVLFSARFLGFLQHLPRILESLLELVDTILVITVLLTWPFAALLPPEVSPNT